MKNKIVYSALLVLILFTVQSCKKDPAGISCSSDGSANFPHLAVGHSLSYYITGILMSDDDTITWTQISSPSAGTYKTDATVSNGAASAYALDGYWHACGRDFYTSTDGNYNQLGHFWISLDANVGDSWTRTQGNQTYYYHLYSKNATVVTSNLGQTFTNCYKFSYNASGSFNVDTIYWKPEIGIVDYEGFLASYELISKNF